jgi:hypothetical protein
MSADPVGVPAVDEMVFSDAGAGDTERARRAGGDRQRR